LVIPRFLQTNGANTDGGAIVDVVANRKGRKRVRVRVRLREAIVEIVILKQQEVGKGKGKWKGEVKGTA
jgi:hypothetical protein